MTIKRGTLVSHARAMEWGVGKVMEVSALKATIQFSDGVTRKIASSHYTVLQPADAASFVQAPGTAPVARVRATPKSKKKVEQPTV